MGLENLMELQILIEGIDHFTEPFRQMENTITGAEAKFKSINSTMKMMGKSKSEIDAINSSLQKMADQKAFAGIAGDLEKIGMAKGDIQSMEQSYMRMAQYQRDMAKAQEDYAAGKDLAMKGVGDLAVGGVGAFGIFELVKQAGEFQSNMAVIQDSTGATTKQMQGLGDAVMNASAQVSKFNDMQMAQIAQTLTSGGFGNVKDVQSLLLPTAKYAEVQMYEHKSSDPIEATKQAIEMAHTFGNYKPKQFESFLNDFNKYSMMQPGDSSQLAQTLTYLAPTANTMHMKQSDTMALAAVDNVLGLTGSHGGTNSADMILRLIPGLVGGGPKVTRDKKGNITKISDPKAWAAMQDLGFIDKKGNSQFFNKDGSIKDLSGMLATMIADSKGKSPKDLMKDYSAIFGVQGGRAAAILSNPRSLEQLGKMRTQLGKTKNMDQINKDLQATPEGQLNLLKSNSMTLMLRLGQQLAISLNPAIAQVNKLLSSMLKFSQAHPGITKIIGDIALFAVGGKIAQGAVELIVGHFKMLSAAVKMFKLTTAAGELTKFGKIISGIGKLFPLLTGPWGLVIAAVAIGAVLIITHWKQVKSFLETAWNAISSTAKSVWNGISSFFKQWGTTLLAIFVPVIGLPILIAQHWQQITTFANQIWNGTVNLIKNIWNGAVNWIKGVAQDFVNIIVDAFKWMYNHNYYFQDLVDSIKKAWDTMIKDATTIWNGFTKLLSDVWNIIKGAAQSFWNGEVTYYTGIWNGIVNIAKTVWNGLSSFFSGLWSAISSGVSSAWNGITNTISSLVNGAVNALKGPFNSLGSFFAGLWSQAEQWGTNLVNMMAKGITNAAGAVGNAVKGVASNIAKVLGFHSPTEEGPASDSDTWMPNMIKMFTKGIQQHAPMLQMAINQVALGMKTGFNQPLTQNIGQAMALSGGSNGNGNIYITVNASGNITRNERELADIVSKGILNKVKMQGRI